VGAFDNSAIIVRDDDDEEEEIGDDKDENEEDEDEEDKDESVVAGFGGEGGRNRNFLSTVFPCGVANTSSGLEEKGRLYLVFKTSLLSGVGSGDRTRTWYILENIEG